MSADSFTDQLSFTVTAEQVKLPWSGKRDGSRFRCGLCGHRFAAGDVVRWNFGKGPLGNFFVCVACDGPDIHDKRQAMYQESKSRFWWLWADIEDLESETRRG